jgi:RNA polymerase sigma factor (sigma-70 family)
VGFVQQKEEMAEPPAIDAAAFRAGERGVLAEVYHRHLARVERAVSRYCRGAEAECVVHDLFLDIIERPELRARFEQGDLGAWLATLARRRALDHLRRQRRFRLLDDQALDGALEPVEPEGSLLERDRARRLAEALERFAGLELPRLDRRLADVFQARFVERRNQLAAAAALGIPRTTLVDREARLMRRLRPFLARQLGEVSR